MEWAWKRAAVLVKVVVHWWTGRSELERICDGRVVHSARMSLRFSSSVWKSKQLRLWRKLIFHHRPFSIAGARDYITAAKKIKATDAAYTVANVTLCLKDLRMLNVMISRLEQNAAAAFDPKKEAHLKLLEKLWVSAFPGQRYPGPTGEAWGSLGFQGLDPATDFRGMGLLGLNQLVVLAAKDQSNFQRLLRLSAGPPAYFPLAATSINMTKLALELLKENRLHGVLFTALSDQTLSLSGQPTEDGEDEGKWAEMLETRFHALFCSLWSEFGELWSRRAPKSIMEFPAIFAEFKAAQHARYPVLSAV